MFNADHATMQYCNGADWIGFPKTSSGCSGIAPWGPSVRTWDAGQQWVTGVYGHAGFIIRSWGGDGLNRVQISADGYNWSSSPSGEIGAFSLAYGDGLYVGVEYSGPTRIKTSPDGANWTQHTAPENNMWQHVTYGGGLFVAVAHDGANRIMTSANGTGWDLRDAGTNVEYKGAVYGDGKYVAVGYGSHVAYSEDGVTWVQHAIPYSTWNSVAYGNGRFVAVSPYSTPRMAVSEDGINWNAHNPPSTANGWGSIVFGNGVFVAVAGSGPDARTMYSVDGLDWTPMPAVQDCWWSGLLYGDGKFIALCTDGDADQRVMVAECGGTACTDPEMPAGRMMYNGDYRVMQWCDGAQWQAMGPVSPPGPNDGCENPAKPGGNLMFSQRSCAVEYCDGDTWQMVGKADPCACDPAPAPCSECDPNPDPCVCGTPNPGDVCGDGTVYAGQSGGNMIFARRCDYNQNWNGTSCSGTRQWRRWKNDNSNSPGTSSNSNGLANTNNIANASHPAAMACRDLGADWYLPARDELALLWTNKDEGAFAGTYDVDEYYWSSTSFDHGNVWVFDFEDEEEKTTYKTNNNDIYVRCIRR